MCLNDYAHTYEHTKIPTPPASDLILGSQELVEILVTEKRWAAFFCPQHPTPSPFLPLTQGTVHQARAEEKAVRAPQAGSSPHHPGSVLVVMPNKPGGPVAPLLVAHK